MQGYEMEKMVIVAIGELNVARVTAMTITVG